MEAWPVESNFCQSVEAWLAREIATEALAVLRDSQMPRKPVRCKPPLASSSTESLGAELLVQGKSKADFENTHTVDGQNPFHIETIEKQRFVVLPRESSFQGSQVVQDFVYPQYGLDSALEVLSSRGEVCLRYPLRVPVSPWFQGKQEGCRRTTAMPFSPPFDTYLHHLLGCRSNRVPFCEVVSTGGVWDVWMLRYARLCVCSRDRSKTRSLVEQKGGNGEEPLCQLGGGTIRTRSGAGCVL